MCNEMAGGVYILHTYIFFKSDLTIHITTNNLEQKSAYYKIMQFFLSVPHCHLLCLQGFYSKIDDNAHGTSFT